PQPEGELTPQIQLGRPGERGGHDGHAGAEREVADPAPERPQRVGRRLRMRNTPLGKDDEDTAGAERAERGIDRAAVRPRGAVDGDDETDGAKDEAVPPDPHRSVAVAEEDDARLRGQERREEEPVRPTLMVRHEEVRLGRWRLAFEPWPEEHPEHRAD